MKKLLIILLITSPIVLAAQLAKPDGTVATLPGDDAQLLFNNNGVLGASDLLTFSRTYSYLIINPLSSVTPVVVPTPSGGSTAWQYTVIAVFNDGTNTGSAGTEILDGPTTLDAENFNTITWEAVAGANHYNLYRSEATGTPSSVGIIWTGTDLSIVDNGLEGDASDASTVQNTTGALQVPRIQLQGPIVSNSDTLILGLPGSPTNNQTIQPAASISGNGASINIFAMDGSSEDDANTFGGEIFLKAGWSGGGDTGGAGNIRLRAGNPNGLGSRGVVLIERTSNDGPLVEFADDGIISTQSITATDFIVSGASIKPLRATSASLGGSALLAGACATNTTTVTGATTSMAVDVSPQTYPGAGLIWDGYVSAADTVTTRVCAILALTPTASLYNIAVIP